MDEAMLYLIIGVMIGAAGTMAVVGAVLWLRSPSEDSASSSLGLAGRVDGAAILPGSAPTRAAPAGMDDVLRVWRSPLGGGLELEFQWRRYRQLADVTDEQVKRELLRVLEDLAAFGRGGTEALPPGEPVLPRLASEESVFPGQVETRSPAASAATSAAAEVEAAFLRSLQTPSPKPVSKPVRGFSWLGLGGRKPAGDIGPASSSESPDAVGIAGQIEQVLQRRLERMPHMAGREIHLSSAPDGSLRVEADGRVYPGIGDVPDPAVREALQAAVREWEAGV